MTHHLGTAMLDYCPHPGLALLSNSPPPPSFLASATPLMHYLKYLTQWVWSTLTLHNIAIVCAIAVVVLPALTCFIIDIFFPPPLPPPAVPQQPAPTAPTTATDPSVEGPINSLPAELLVEVLVNLNPGRPHFDDLYAAMRVCWAWRRSAFCAPHLWCAIELGHTMPAAQFNAYLWRSKTVPLSVTLGSGASELHVALLISHMHRLRALQLAPIPASDALTQLLLRPAPVLQCFRIAVGGGTNQSHWRLPHALFAGQAPVLKELHALSHQLPDIGCMALAKVERFEPGHTLGVRTRDPTPADIATVLRSLPALLTAVVGAPSAAPANSPLPAIRCPTNLQYLHVLSMTTSGFTDVTRAGLSQMLNELSLPTVIIYRADAAVVHDTFACPVNNAPVAHLLLMRTESGGRLILSAAAGHARRSFGHARRSFVSVPVVEFAKTLQDTFIFSGLTALTLSGILPTSDLSLPAMPLLCQLQVVFTWDFKPESCFFKAIRSRNLHISWLVPQLRELSVHYGTRFGIVFAKDIAPLSTARPFISAGDVAHFITHTLAFGNGNERLDRLRVSQCLQIEEVGGHASVEFEELRALAIEFRFDSDESCFCNRCLS
ncbi:hypothetical protein EXIGLDRAFT_732960 [Exidia glandulosa HHB12029]|uniref:F-box domain-containing protein n=1 Tax=Exidia glandulosa HHB12029 TaxID=1314781 RepID=A0A165PVA6_EXIGL|nr:hypothetical protein EXIGLDRAFT_732960 [Exidia glandulosa HHB12029]